MRERPPRILAVHLVTDIPKVDPPIVAGVSIDVIYFSVWRPTSHKDPSQYVCLIGDAIQPDCPASIDVNMASNVTNPHPQGHFLAPIEETIARIILQALTQPA